MTIALRFSDPTFLRVMSQMTAEWSDWIRSLQSRMRRWKCSMALATALISSLFECLPCSRIVHLSPYFHSSPPISRVAPNPYNNAASVVRVAWILPHVIGITISWSNNLYFLTSVQAWVVRGVLVPQPCLASWATSLVTGMLLGALLVRLDLLPSVPLPLLPDTLVCVFLEEDPSSFFALLPSVFGSNLQCLTPCQGRW